MQVTDIVRKIVDDTGIDIRTAEEIADRLLRVNGELMPLVESWLRGENVSFEFQGITLEDIQKKQKYILPLAISTMDILMTTPALAEGYLEWEPCNEDWIR